jgi:hypothetical protein
MNMLQHLFVGLIVAWAAWVAAMRLLPRAWRTALRQRLAAIAGAAGWPGLEQRLAAPSGAATCGGCDNCGGKPTEAAKPDGVVGGISPDALRRTIRR